MQWLALAPSVIFVLAFCIATIRSGFGSALVFYGALFALIGYATIKAL